MIDFKKHKGKIIAVIAIIIIVIISYFFDGDKKNVTPHQNDRTIINSAIIKSEISEDKNEEPVTTKENENIENPKQITEQKETIKPSNKKAEATEEKPENELMCTISVKCDTVLQNFEKLNPDKKDIIPENSVLIPEFKAKFYEGENVFNVMLRELKLRKIHFEFVNTPVYKSTYIEGIANLYELDCGELSGWMYKVNGEFPNYGCSKYTLKNNDKIEWVYTCDLGKDVGGDYRTNNGG